MKSSCAVFGSQRHEERQQALGTLLGRRLQRQRQLGRPAHVVLQAAQHLQPGLQRLSHQIAFAVAPVHLAGVVRHTQQELLAEPGLAQARALAHGHPEGGARKGARERLVQHAQLGGAPLQRCEARRSLASKRRESADRP